VAKPKNSFEAMALNAASRIDQARAAGEQLTFLPDEAGAPPVDTIERKAGRPVGARNKASSQMRDWLAANGYRFPEDQLAQMAGLASRDSAIVTAMQQAEHVLTWAFAGSKDKDGKAMLPTPQQRMVTFSQLYTQMLRAADALLPYGAPKATPDVTVQQAIQINVPGAPAQADPAANAKVINPKSGRRMVPLDVALESEQNQPLTETQKEKSDAESRME